MAMQSFPFTSEVTFDDSGFPQFDRAVGSDVLRSILSNYYTNGVFGIGNNNSFKVVAATGGGMSLTVKPGACLINGATGYNMDETRIIIPNSDAQPRIDLIVLRLDDNKAQRSIRVEVVKGTPQSQPVKPTPVREGAVYDLVLANVMVRANVSTITNADITDTRLDKNACGFVSAVNNLNMDALYTQQRALFDAWFEGIKNQLGTDAAGNLQNQINTLNPKVNAVNNALTFSGQNVTAKGQLDVAGKLNAKNGLAIGGNDTFIVRRFTAPRQTVNYNSSNLTVVNINVPSGYSMIAPISATTTGCLCNIHSWNTTSVTLYVGNMWNDGYVLPAGEINVDVLLVRKAA
jgi:conserved domain protein